MYEIDAEALGDPPALLGPLRDALDGGPVVVIANDDDALRRIRELANEIPGGTAVIVSTSGSTGTPKSTLIPASALQASAGATRERLGGPGQWLLALPVQYIAGLQVLIRSVLDGTEPAVVPPGPFTADGFVRATQTMTGERRYVPLVPTQLTQLLESPEASAAIDALRSFDAVLLGGARADRRLLERAHELGIPIVTTYGMSETCGGCVYDGVPLPGVQVRKRDGRLQIGGDVVASGYLGAPELTAQHFTEDDGTRWFTTSDVGTVDDGLVSVAGRADDVIITGGLKVDANVLAATIEELDDVRSAFVIGLPDATWGQRVAAWVVPTTDDETETLIDRIHDHVSERLGRRMAPKLIYCTPELPLLESGKPDRLRITNLLAEKTSE